MAAVFRFPGQRGEDNYPLQPGARVVLARDAVDDGADVELGHADWEFHVPDDDFDNPDVPNLEIVFGDVTDGELPEAGGVLLATGEDQEPPIDDETVMDGVNYGLEDPAAWLPTDTLTAEGEAHPGCSVGQSLQRVGPDTNNSSDDFQCAAPLLAADVAMGLEVIDLAVALDGTTRPPAQDVGPAPAAALASGRVVTFTILIQNLGGVEALAATVTEDLPDELAFLSYTSLAPVTLVSQPDPLVWEVEAIPPGAAYGIVVQALAEAGVSGTLTSTVEIETEGDWDVSNNWASAQVTLAEEVEVPTPMPTPTPTPTLTPPSALVSPLKLPYILKGTGATK